MAGGRAWEVAEGWTSGMQGQNCYTQNQDLRLLVQHHLYAALSCTAIAMAALVGACSGMLHPPCIMRAPGQHLPDFHAVQLHTPSMR